MRFETLGQEPVHSSLAFVPGDIGGQAALAQLGGAILTLNVARWHRHVTVTKRFAPINEQLALGSTLFSIAAVGDTLLDRASTETPAAARAVIIRRLAADQATFENDIGNAFALAFGETGDAAPAEDNLRGKRAAIFASIAARTAVEANVDESRGMIPTFVLVASRFDTDSESALATLAAVVFAARRRGWIIVTFVILTIRLDALVKHMPCSLRTFVFVTTVLAAVCEHLFRATTAFLRTRRLRLRRLLIALASYAVAEGLLSALLARLFADVVLAVLQAGLEDFCGMTLATFFAGRLGRLGLVAVLSQAANQRFFTAVTASVLILASGDAFLYDCSGVASTAFLAGRLRWRWRTVAKFQTTSDRFLDLRFALFVGEVELRAMLTHLVGESLATLWAGGLRRRLAGTVLQASTEDRFRPHGALALHVVAIITVAVMLAIALLDALAEHHLGSLATMLFAGRLRLAFSLDATPQGGLEKLFALVGIRAVVTQTLLDASSGVPLTTLFAGRRRGRRRFVTDFAHTALENSRKQRFAIFHVVRTVTIQTTLDGLLSA